MTAQKYIIFDFDGTLVDSVDLAVEIYNKIAPKYNCKPVEHEAREILSSKNPRVFFKTYGITPFKLFLLVYRIRRELGKHIPHIEPVAGMEKALRSLRNHGYKLGILTSNSKSNVEDFLDHNHLKGLFSFVYSGRKLLGKDKSIIALLKKEKINKENVVYVGDETRDVLAMKKVNIPVIAVGWGLTNPQKLASLLPDLVLETPDNLKPEAVEILFRKS